MLQITITDPTNREREIVRELLDHWPSFENEIIPFEEQPMDIPELKVPRCEDPPPVIGTNEILEIDKDGLPWDERIHSSNRQFTQDGYWRKRRGVTEDQVTTVESELRGTPPPPPPPPVVEPANPMGAFITLVGRTMAAIGGKTLTQERVNEVCLKHGVTSLPALGQYPNLIPAIEAELFP